MATRSVSRLSWIATAVLTAAVVALVGRHGSQQEAEQARVLGGLDPVVDALRSSGAWLITVCFDLALPLALAVALATGALAALAFRRSERRAAGFAILLAAVALAALAQGALFSGFEAVGATFYGVAFVVAIFAGYLLSSSRSTGESPGPPRRLGSDGESIPRWHRFEPPLLLALLVVALVMRVYALPELSAGYESEMMISMLSTRTLVGLRKYVPWGLISNTNGLAHLLPQWVSFSLLGTSVFAIRFTAAVCGVVCTAIFYGMARRLCRPSIALLVTLLFLTAPEQLSWARQENTPFQFVTLSAVITGALALRFIDRPVFSTWLVLCLWLPLSRYFYGPGMVMMLIPPALYVHSLIFVRGSWRQAWYAVPMLLLAIVGWIFSLTIARGLVSGDDWGFIHPAESSGGAVWEAEGTFRGASATDLVKLHAVNLAKNLASTAVSFTYNGGFTDWYERVDRTAHPTFLNAAIPPMVVAGLGLLLGQIARPRAFLLLIWISVGILPAVLSVDPAPRRMGASFPALYLVIGVLFSVLVSEARRSAGVAATRATQLGLTLVTLLVAWAGATSYFLLPMRLTFLDPWFRATRPVFEQSDAIYYNIIPHWALVLAWGHGDILFRGDDTACFDPIGPGGALAKLLTLRCTLEDPAMTNSLSTASLEAIRHHDPQRVSLLLRDEPTSVPDLKMVQAVFPDAIVRDISIRSMSVSPLKWIVVDRAQIDVLRRPLLERAAVSAAAKSVTDVLADVALQPEVAVIDGQRVRASLLVERSNWYRLTLSPACVDAVFAIDDEERVLGTDVPLTRGAHALRLSLPSDGSCELPAQLRISSIDAPEPRAPILVSPKLAELATVRAQPLLATAGYDYQEIPPRVEGAVLDIQADESGGLWVLSLDSGTPRITHLAEDGEPLRTFEIPPPRPMGLSLAPDGTLFVPYDGGPVRLFNPDGTPAGELPAKEIATTVLGHLADGSVLFAAPSRNAIDRLDRQGKLLASWTDIDAPEVRFAEPWSVRVSTEGDIVVAESDGTALVFKTPIDHFAPTFQREFKLELHDTPTSPRGWMLDGVNRQVMVPDTAIAAITVVDLDGKRRLSRDPARDLNRMLRAPAERITGNARSFYVLEQAGRLLKVSAREAESR